MRSIGALAATARLTRWEACSAVPCSWSRNAVHHGQRQQRGLPVARAGAVVV
jgi:hypothetical protein